jgi:isoquinoline 1-oxidoreductase beta subunit
VHSSGKKLGYGELVEVAAKQAVPGKQDLQFKSPADYRYIGKELPIVDLTDLCTGKGVFGIDAQMPGMVHASIERSPVYGGTVQSVDDKETRAVKGVLQTVVLPRFTPPVEFKALGGVAVIADNTWAAIKGREKLKVQWDPGANAVYDSAKYKQALFDTVHQPQKPARNVGDVDAEFAKDGKTHEATYYAPHLSHAPMEPPAAVADVKDDKVVVYAATQNPQAVQKTVADALGIDAKKVECHVTLLGGGFGRKSKPDYAAEAALLSKQLGKPVKVTWTREDDIRFDFYHSVAAMYLKAALDDKGKPTALLQRTAFPSIAALWNPAVGEGQSWELGMGYTNLPFDIPNQRVENGPAKAHVRVGWLRSVANIYHAFAAHSFADELAARAGRDLVEYLLELVGPPRKIDLGDRSPTAQKYPLDTERLRRVIQLAAEKSGWAKKPASKGHALGIAAHWSFYSYVAAVVEVEVDDKGKIRIPQVDLAADVGTIINPDRVRSQFEGASVFGASLALMGEITAANGAIVQSNFDDYPVARIQEAPIVTNVHLVPSTEPPAGVGEPGVPPMAPALCNAIFAATGQRIRELPIKNHKLA